MSLLNEPQTLPFLYEDDGYQLRVVQLSPKQIQLDAIHCYPNNINSSGVAYRFFDLPPSTRDAILNHLRRRFPGATVKI